MTLQLPRWLLPWLALGSFVIAAPPYPHRLGVEASGDAFVDLVRESYRWEKADGKNGWTSLTPADVDEHG